MFYHKISASLSREISSTAPSSSWQVWPGLSPPELQTPSFLVLELHWSPLSGRPRDLTEIFRTISPPAADTWPYSEEENFLTGSCTRSSKF